VDKSPDAFRTISEVAADLDLPQHVLRFWETRFVQIRPLKRGGGRRYYRPDDVDLLKGIRHLLYGEGYTIRGVQRILKEQGVRFVMNVWAEGAPQPPPADPRFDDEPVRDEPSFDDEPVEDAALPPDDAYSPYAPHHLAPAVPPRPAGEPDFAVPAVRADPSDAVPSQEPTVEMPRDGEGAAAMAQRFAPRLAGEAEAAPPPVDHLAPRPPAAVVRPPSPPPAARPADAAEPRSGLGQFFDRLRPAPGRDVEVPVPRTVQTLSRDEIRRLQSTLFELLECKRLLDQVR